MAVTRASSAASRASTLSTSKITKNKNIKNSNRAAKSTPKIAKPEKHQKLVATSSAARLERTKAKSPGIRIIAGRIYDSENGKTCHQCRQKTLDFTVSCKNHTGERQCTFHYCHICLLNRYGEKAEEVAALGCKWKCPCCRGVCNCCKCMKKRGCMPTGILLPIAKSCGYSSVSEMLQLEKIVKPKNNGVATHRKRKASDEASAASSKRGREKSGLDEKANSICLSKSLKTKGNKNDNTSSKKSKTKASDGNGSAVKGKDKKDATAKKRISRVNATLTKVPIRQEEVSRSLRRATGYMKPQEKISRKLINARHNESDELTKVKSRSIAAEKTEGEIQLGEKIDLQNDVLNVEIPLPQATVMTRVATLDLPAEDIGHALQFVEFCEAFGQVLDLKKGQSEFLLQELTCGQNMHRRCNLSLERLHIKLLSMIEKDSENGCASLKARGRNSWLEALEKHISACSYVSKKLTLGCSHLSREGYSKLDGSKKLRILTFLCDEALGTTEVRMWIDKKNMEFIQERKKVWKMLLDEEKNNMIRLENEVAKAILMSNGAPLSIAEHENLVAKIKMEASHHFPHSDMRATLNSAVVRLNPVLSDACGRKFWKLRSYSGGMDVLLQDVARGDGVTSEEKWFVYDLHEKANVERYISSFKEPNIEIDFVSGNRILAGTVLCIICCDLGMANNDDQTDLVIVPVESLGIKKRCLMD